MKEVPLTKGKVALVDDLDYERVAAHKWYCSIGRCNIPYAVRKSWQGGREYIHMMHRYIVNPLPGWVVDHIDHDTLNNCRANLRVVTASENQANSLRRVARYRGVRPGQRSGTWVAMIKAQGVQRYLGTFDTEIEAALAYDEAAWRLFGSCAHLNIRSAA